MQQVGECSGDHCPDARDDDDSVVVRGEVVDAATLDRSAGGAVMRLPRAMVLDTVGRLAQG